MRILHINASFTPISGGPYYATRGMCKALAARGHEVTVYTTDVGGPHNMNPLLGRIPRLRVPTGQPMPIDGYEVWYFPVRWPSRCCFSPDFARALAKTVRTYDLVHIHSLYEFTTQASAYLCRRAGVPYLIRPHGTLDPFLRSRSYVKKWLYDSLLQRRDLDHAAAVHYTTDEEMRLVQPLGFRAPGIVVPLGLDLDEFKSLPERGLFRGRHLRGWSGQLVLYLGRINFKKGLEILVDAFAQVCQARPDVALAIVGYDDPLEYGRSIRQMVVERQITDRVTFTGPLVGQDKLAALADADVWVLASHSENFGVAVVEAMACGLPVIVSNKVNLYSNMADTQAGLVIDCDAQQLTVAINRLLDDPAERKRLGENGQRLVGKKFSLETVGRQLETVYRGILSCTS